MNSRREFLTRLGVGALAATGVAGLAACGKGGGGGGATACTDPTGASKATRDALKYTDTTPKPDQRCDNCALYVAAPEGCGKCKIFSDSPVAPAGWCSSWAKKA